ncbi:hypothetical protein ANANG_G00089420 [Anguilla anguilla]|uniref:F-box domain-containing protein n=1 Tax=Anguilla anguilla TaxID=7936 RepID=A0A9D3S0W2_ANGAN|nr:hypothetical protein ANANG_G00089420 [Anguilla anguilla]
MTDCRLRPEYADTEHAQPCSYNATQLLPLSPAVTNGSGSSTSSSITGETVAIVHAPPSSMTHAKKQSHPPKVQQAAIDLLPDHAFLQIFSHLPTNQLCRCARVCRRWYNLAWDPGCGGRSG